MALTVKHMFESAKADGPNVDMLQPSHWNAEHWVEGTTFVSAEINITDETIPQFTGGAKYVDSNMENWLQNLVYLETPPAEGDIVFLYSEISNAAYPFFQLTSGEWIQLPNTPDLPDPNAYITLDSTLEADQVIINLTSSIGQTPPMIIKIGNISRNLRIILAGGSGPAFIIPKAPTQWGAYLPIQGSFIGNPYAFMGDSDFIDFTYNSITDIVTALIGNNLAMFQDGAGLRGIGSDRWIRMDPNVQSGQPYPRFYVADFYTARALGGVFQGDFGVVNPRDDNQLMSGNAQQLHKHIEIVYDYTEAGTDIYLTSIEHVENLVKLPTGFTTYIPADAPVGSTFNFIGPGLVNELVDGGQWSLPGDVKISITKITDGGGYITTPIIVGANDTFISADGKNVAVNNGIITSITT